MESQLTLDERIDMFLSDPITSFRDIKQEQYQKGKKLIEIKAKAFNIEEESFVWKNNKNNLITNGVLRYYFSTFCILEEKK